MTRNKLKHFRESQLLSKAELARRAGISPITLDRIEKGLPCRMETQRKILDALGLKPSQKARIFDE
ncbi:MAG: helix-turn-helix transcriptional regulator [Desulfatibacillaceae bacterium]|nr:helix-turn-helix transcriptional regulator [Desulfatibacillaceae bacterium]